MHKLKTLVIEGQMSIISQSVYGDFFFGKSLGLYFTGIVIMNKFLIMYVCM